MIESKFLKNVLVIGGVIFDDDRESVCASCKKSLPNFASDTHLRSFLDGLAENGITYSLINATALGNYPQTSSITFFSPKNRYPNEHITNISFTNIFLFKQLSIKRQVHKLVRDWMHKNHDGGSIFIYGLYSPFILGLPKVDKRLFKVITIIPDIPVFFNATGRTFIYKYLKMIEFHKMKKRLLGFDLNITLTKYMAKEICLNEKTCYVIEGFGPKIDRGKSAIEPLSGSVVYTGKLDKEFGLRTLFDAFDKINIPSKHLFLYGNGNDIEYLKNRARDRTDVTISMVTDKETLYSIQRKAYVLVNPRSPKNAFTRFSFPSKTMEYLASGRPVIMGKLDGIPPEYDDYLNYCDVDDSTKLAAAIENVLNKNQKDLLISGEKQLSFLEKNKNPKALVKGFLDFFNEQYHEN